MADLSLTSEQELLRSTARDFIERECSLAEVRRIDEEQDGFSRELWQQTAALGWHGLLIPTAYGGADGSLADAAVLYEEIGRGLLPGPHHSSAVLAAQVLLRAGSESQQARLLPAIASGKRIVTLAFTEQRYGWTPDHAQMAARLRDGGYVLSGTKQFVPDAGAADEIIVAARTEDRLTLFLIESDAPGVERRIMRGFVGEPLYEVSFRDVAVSPDGVVGEPGRGWDALEPSFDVATAVLCAAMAGACRRVYEMSLGYARRRVQFGQPIARFQRVQDRLIEMVNHADAARLTAHEAVWKLEQSRPDAQAAVSVAKAAASEGFYQSCEHAHHVHGGIGSDKAYGLYLYTKASRSLYHYLGSPEHHRSRLVRLLGLSTRKAL